MKKKFDYHLNFSKLIIIQKFQMLTSSILETQIRKSPNIRQVDRKSDDRQQKVDFSLPSLSVTSTVTFTAVAVTGVRYASNWLSGRACGPRIASFYFSEIYS